jgi:hypothetical protein
LLIRHTPYRSCFRLVSPFSFSKSALHPRAKGPAGDEISSDRSSRKYQGTRCTRYASFSRFSRYARCTRKGMKKGRRYACPSNVRLCYIQVLTLPLQSHPARRCCGGDPGTCGLPHEKSRYDTCLSLSNFLVLTSPLLTCGLLHVLSRCFRSLGKHFLESGLQDADAEFAGGTCF